MLNYNYVINLDRREDRWKEFLSNQNKTCLKNENFIRFSAFDGYNYENEIKRFSLENHVIIKFLKKIKLSVSKGVFGCLMSHLLVLNEILNNKNIKDDEYVGIYEEDFCYSNNFDENYLKFKSIDLNSIGVEFIYLGGRFNPDFDCSNDDKIFEKTSHSNIFFRKNLIYRNFNWDRGAFSYVVKKSICTKLIEIISSTFVKNENNIIRFEAIDYVYTNANKMIKMYDYFPHLFYSHVNFNSDIQGSLLQNKIQF